MLRAGPNGLIMLAVITHHTDVSLSPLQSNLGLFAVQCAEPGFPCPRTMKIWWHKMPKSPYRHSLTCHLGLEGLTQGLYKLQDELHGSMTLFTQTVFIPLLKNYRISSLLWNTDINYLIPKQDLSCQPLQPKPYILSHIRSFIMQVVERVAIICSTNNTCEIQ